MCEVHDLGAVEALVAEFGDLFVALTLFIGVRTYAKIRGRATNYYVAGNAMPVGVVGITLCAQAFDANGSVGNASLVHSGGFWAGAVIPVGLALCLFIAGTWFAEPLHRMRLMTLADFYRRRYSVPTETLAAGLMLLSNVVLVAGNLAGLGLLFELVFGAPYLAMLVAVALCILAYAVSGGLYATIATSVLQVSIFIVSIVVAFVWLGGSHGWGELLSAAPEGAMSFAGLFSRESGALVNWAALGSLALGDIVAIDFIQRMISADSGRSAKRGCYLAGGLTLVVGLTVSLIGLSAHYFGRDAGSSLLVDLALTDLPLLIGGAVLLGIIAASMSTASGVVLDLANVITRNLVQRHSRSTWDDERMLRFSRWIALPTMAGAVVFAYVRPEPGILLILAFDIVLAGCFVPLLLGLFWRKANMPGALAGVMAGSAARLALHFAVTDAWRGLDTLLAPVFSLIAMVAVSLMTRKTHPPRHEELRRVPSERDLVAGLDG